MEYWRVMLKNPDRKNKAEECVRAGYIGVDTAILGDVGNCPDERKDFIRHLLPAYMKNRPHKTEKGSEQTLGGLWRVAKVMAQGDIVLSPSGSGFYYVGTISGGYYYDEGREFFHCRPIKWSDKKIRRADMPEPLQKATGAPGTVANVSKYAEEINRLLGDTD